MKRVAYIIEDRLFERRGLMNATLNKIKHLKNIAEYDIDVFAIQMYYGFIVRHIKKEEAKKRINEVYIDDIRINVIWKKFSLIDYLLTYKIHLKPITNWFFIKKIAPIFKEYNLLSTHSIGGGELASYVKNKYGIPFVSSWYGSDVHTYPGMSHYYFSVVKKTMDSAEENFYVSKHLLTLSDNISKTTKKEVLYVGVRDGFYKYSDDKRHTLKLKYDIIDCKVIAFAGGLVDVKNPLVLPDIFDSLSKKYNGKLKFWIIGSGDLKGKIQEKFDNYDIDVKLWGFVSDALLPELLNCIDVLVLPSINEGLPLITLEALSCGANVVGSRVGGIPEAIGMENSFQLNESFVESISTRMQTILENNIKQELLEHFSWMKSAENENNLYKRLLNGI